MARPRKCQFGVFYFCSVYVIVVVLVFGSFFLSFFFSCKELGSLFKSTCAKMTGDAFNSAFNNVKLQRTECPSERSSVPPRLSSFREVFKLRVHETSAEAGASTGRSFSCSEALQIHRNSARCSQPWCLRAMFPRFHRSGALSPGPAA